MGSKPHSFQEQRDESRNVTIVTKAYSRILEEPRCRIIEELRKHEQGSGILGTPTSGPKVREITACRGEAVRAPQTTAPLEAADGDPKEQRPAPPQTLIKRDP